MVLPKRHIVNLRDFKAIEAQDIMKLITEMKELLNNTYNEDILISMNTGKHSTQEHIHFHIMPSKGSLRDLISKFENVPKRMRKPNKVLEKMKDKLHKRAITCYHLLLFS